MSAIDDSFIVLEETPSMLQFSLLDSSILDTEITTKSIDTNKSLSSLEINASASSEISTKFNDKIKDAIAELSSEILSTSITKTQPVNYISSENVLNDVDDRQQNQTPPKTTLAQSFLLGDINCDKMKVNKSKSL